MDLESIVMKPDLSRNAKGQIGHNAYKKMEARKFKIQLEADARREKEEQNKKKLMAGDLSSRRASMKDPLALDDKALDASLRAFAEQITRR